MAERAIGRPEFLGPEGPQFNFDAVFGERSSVIFAQSLGNAGNPYEIPLALTASTFLFGRHDFGEEAEVEAQKILLSNMEREFDDNGALDLAAGYATEYLLGNLGPLILDESNLTAMRDYVRRLTTTRSFNSPLMAARFLVLGGERFWDDDFHEEMLREAHDEVRSYLDRNPSGFDRRTANAATSFAVLTMHNDFGGAQRS